MTWWWAILGAGLGCYLLKLAGLSVPARVLARPQVQRIADLIPVALLAALVAVQVFASGTHLIIDARAAGLAAAVVALLLRAPFLVVVVVAALTASLLRVVFAGW
jgi:branched-subunit amino acid transport protein